MAVNWGWYERGDDGVAGGAMLPGVVEGGASEGESNGGMRPLEEGFGGDCGLVISIGAGLSPWLEGAASAPWLFSIIADGQLQ